MCFKNDPKLTKHTRADGGTTSSAIDGGVGGDTGGDAGGEVGGAAVPAATTVVTTWEAGAAEVDEAALGPGAVTWEGAFVLCSFIDTCCEVAV